MDSSDEDSYVVQNGGAPRQKKRRLPGACDACRKKKTKCNSSEMPNNICSQCITLGIPCLHEVPYRKRNNKEYIDYLEQKNQTMERLLRELQKSLPDRDLLKEVEIKPPSLNASNPIPSSNTASTTSGSSSSQTIQPSDALSHLSTGQYSDDEDPGEVDISNQLQNMNINLSETRFFGKGSNFDLMRQAIQLKEDYEGAPSRQMATGKFKRDHYWTVAPWERGLLRFESKRNLTFPPPDLLQSLVSLYFRRMNVFFPIIHAPTFERHVSEQLHLKDYAFGRLVLLVCAIGSRFSSDPRVLLDPNRPNTLTAGFKWFEQVNMLQTRYLFDTLNLTDVQAICLAMIYIFGMTIPQGTWILLGVGLRSCQERGVHKRLPGGSKSTKTFEDELWKRAFWYLVSVDRQLTTFFGRPSAVASEDIEIDYPEECDDEHWRISSSGTVTFHQPPNKPSVPTGFCVHLRLCELYAVSRRTLYASSRSRAIFGITGDDWESKVVTELDSSLNSWLDNVPDHLRWDPSRDNPVHFDQSCFLYTIFYGLQIQIHRPFIQMQQSPLAFPSLAICTNSARSCSHVLDAQVRRGAMRLPNAMMTANASAFVLLMNLYGAKRVGITMDPERELNAVDMLRRYLGECDKHWHLAGRFVDLITELASVHTTLPTPTAPSLKRSRRDRDSEFYTGTQAPLTCTPSTQQHNMYAYHDNPSPTTPASVPISGRSMSSRTSPPQTHSAYAASSTSTQQAPLDSPSPPDWNINPYAFPSMPENNHLLHPEFYIEPSMKPATLGLEELERLSQSLTGSNSYMASGPPGFGPPAHAPPQGHGTAGGNGHWYGPPTGAPQWNPFSEPPSRTTI